MVVRHALPCLISIAVCVGGCIEERRGHKRRAAKSEAAAATVDLASPDEVDDRLSKLVTGDRMRVAVDPGDPWKGAADPLVTIVEYSDFQCPFCSKLANNLDRLVALYPEDVRIVFKQFPLESHTEAESAARAALAAHAQGKFWPMHDLLFENPQALGPADLERYAAGIGLDVAKFKATMLDPTLQKRVSEQINEGRVLQLRSTPTFYANGRQTVGARDLEALQQLVEEEKAHALALVDAGSKRSEVYARIMKVAQGGAGKPATTDPTHRRGEASKGTAYALPLGKGARRGPDDALVTIVEFGAFTCPDCRAARRVIDEVMIKHPEIRHVVRQFPTEGDATSMLAAKALVAAQRQDKFWPLRDALLSFDGAIDPVALERAAGNLGMDGGELARDMNDADVAAQIERDMADANHVRGTATPPFFFVNGVIVTGVPVVADLEKLIDAEKTKAETFMSEKGTLRKELYEAMRKTWRGADLMGG